MIPMEIEPETHGLDALPTEPSNVVEIHPVRLPRSRLCHYQFFTYAHYSARPNPDSLIDYISSYVYQHIIEKNDSKYIPISTI